MIKKADIFLGLGLIAAAVLALLFLGGGDGEAVVTVRQRGEIVYQGPLAQDEEISLAGDFHNVIKIQSGEVFYAHSNCPGQDCVKMGRLSGPGQLACAPNETIVVVERRESGVDSIAG